VAGGVAERCESGQVRQLAQLAVGVDRLAEQRLGVVSVLVGVAVESGDSELADEWRDAPAGADVAGRDAECGQDRDQLREAPRRREPAGWWRARCAWRDALRNGDRAGRRCGRLRLVEGLVVAPAWPRLASGRLALVLGALDELAQSPLGVAERGPVLAHA
jgi:hypothetical protein